jgi:hypothetical protein
VVTKIIIDGQAYPIVECLGFVSDIGMRAWIVRCLDGSEAKVVGTRKSARFWTAEDRVKPLVEAVSKGWPSNAQRKMLRME